MRAWKELQMEKFLKRLLLEEPELEYVFGEAIDSMGDYFFEFFDCCIHELQPETQNIVGEPLMGVPPEKADGLDTVEDYGQLFADLGMRPQHWLKARQVWMWMLPSIPYLEEYDRQDLEKSANSALYRFFNSRVILPMVKALQRYELALPPEMLKRMVDSWQVFSQNKQEMGSIFYQTLFEKYPFVLPIFGRADMDYLSLHLFQSLEFLMRCLRSERTNDLLMELRYLGQLHGSVGVPSCAYPAISDTMFVLFEKYVPDFSLGLRQAWQTLFNRVTNIMKLPKLNEERLLKKAKQYLDIISHEQAWEPEDKTRRTTAPKLNVTFLNPNDAANITPIQVSGDKGIEVPLVANQELLQEVIPGSRSTRYIVFDLANTDLQYETGDHVAVYPCNAEDAVNRLCNRLGVTSDTYLTANYVKTDGKPTEDKAPFTVPTTVGQVLREELDLALREPFNDLLAYMYTAAAAQDKQRLETWLEILRLPNDHPDNRAFLKTITDNFMSVVDLFDEFPTVDISLGALIELLPKQKPRLYSISSSPLLYPQHIQITVGILQVKTDAGKVRQGLCSNYLAGLEVGAKVRIGVRTSTFRPPSDPDATMLMVGPGTGVSPLIAFLQYRQAQLQQGQHLSNASLYFGCRNHSDFIYQEQLQTWQTQGVLSNLEVAFSRVGAQKMYVQNLMEQNPEKLWRQLSNPKCQNLY